jgi:hypothetical protein
MPIKIEEKRTTLPKLMAGISSYIGFLKKESRIKEKRKGRVRFSQYRCLPISLLCAFRLLPLKSHP